MRHSLPARPKPGLPIRIVLVLTAALLLFPHAAHAATIVVDETTCTLIDAILAANTDLPTGGCPAGSGGDTIELTTDVALTAVHAAPPGVGNLGLPILASQVTLQGGGHTIARDPAAPEFGLMMMESDTWQSLKNVTLSNGASGFRGGAILNASGNDLYLDAVTLSNNSALEGGGIASHGRIFMDWTRVSGNTSVQDGAGIWNEGRIYMDNSEVSDNSAARHGGGIFNGCGDMYLENSTVSSNNAAFYGGGIDGSTCPGSARIELRSVTVASNTAGAAGGGLYFRDGTWRLDYSVAGHNGPAGNCAREPAATVYGYGINFDDDGTCDAVYTELGFLTGLDPILADNGGPTRTHALLADSSAIDATDSSACPDIDQRGEPREPRECDIGAYELQPEPIVVDEVNCSLVDAFVAVNNGSPTNGCVPPRGRATIILTTDVTLTEPYDDIFGAVGVPCPEHPIRLLGGHHTIARAADAPPFRFGTVENNYRYWMLYDVTLTNFSVAGGESLAGKGGAILNMGYLGLTRVTLSGNSAKYGGGIAVYDYGELYMDSCSVSDNSASHGGGGLYTTWGVLGLTNSTVSGNSAPNGGGIQHHGSHVYGTQVTLKNVTVAGNLGEYGSGVGSVYRATSFENTIVAGNGPGSNCAGPSTDLGNNFDEFGDCGAGFGVVTGLDPTLADNGGPTLTHALLPESSAIDAAGDCGLETDQRGMPRNDDACDSGAYEFQCSIELYLADDVTWIVFAPDQAAFDIVTGDLADLRADGGFDDALCMGSYPVSPAFDLLSDPAPGEGRYYLAKGLTSCVGAGYGDSSLNPESQGRTGFGTLPVSVGARS